MLKRILLGLIFAAALGAFAASSYFPEFYHAWNPKEGGWSKYTITDSRGEVADITFSVVGQEGSSTWFEVASAQEGFEAVAAFLVKGDPTDDANVLMVRAHNPGDPAMEIDKPTLERLKQKGMGFFGTGNTTAIGPTFGKLQGMPDETLTVGKKKFPCKHLKVVGTDGREAEVWLHDDVSPFSIVKLVSGTESVVLKEFGVGAKPKVKGPFKRLDVQ
jgi:hypothetical protein